MLVMLRAFPYPILNILCYIPQNTHLPYLTFFTFLILPSQATIYVQKFYQSNDGLYVMSESSTMSIPQAYWSPCVSATIDMWHHQLSHPTSRVFNFLASKNKIACLLGKSSCLL
jgi:hypothetical protein